MRDLSKKAEGMLRDLLLWGRLGFDVFFLFGMTGFLPGKTLEAAESYCESPYNLAARIEACPDNRLFTEAADQCREKFELEVQAVTKNLSAAFERNDDRSVSAQDSKHLNHGENLSGTDSGLRKLIAHAHQIRRDYENYVTTIILPGNPGLDLLMAYNIYDLLAENECYRGNRIRLEQQIAWIEFQIRELKRADAETNYLHFVSDQRTDRLEGVSTAPVKTTHAVGSGRIPSGRHPKQESTITGKIRNEKLP